MAEQNKNKIPRRRFIKSAFAASCSMGLLCPALFGDTKKLPVLDYEETHFIREARHYEKLPGNVVRCKLCPRECVVDDYERGSCGVRDNLDGVYRTMVYSRICSYNIDPIEKKPLFHFLPGTTAFSIATAGCNIECKFCQNWQISQFRPEDIQGKHLPPEKVAETALLHKAPTIAYTYSEPTVFYEYMYDCAKYAQKKGIRSVMISNGYIKEKPMRELCAHLDAVKIDFKGYTENFYKEYCNGEMKPVLETLKLLNSLDKWLEIVVLIIPTLNDSEREISDMSQWIMDNLGPDVPIHFTRFHPAYKLKNLPSTPVKTIERSREIAMNKGIRYVYSGNIPGHKGESTYCHECGQTLIRRIGYHIQTNNMKSGRCKFCSAAIPGVWE